MSHWLQGCPLIIIIFRIYVRGPTDPKECQNIVNLKEVKQKHTLKGTLFLQYIIMMLTLNIHTYWRIVFLVTQINGAIWILEVESHDLYIPLKSVTDAIQSFFFTPGLHFDGRRISFVRQMPMFDTQTIGDADIVTIDTGSSTKWQDVLGGLRKWQNIYELSKLYNFNLHHLMLLFRNW